MNLYIAALKEEVIDIAPLLVTGIGTMNCALSLIDALATARAHGTLPTRLVNLGTAGALKDGVSGVFEVEHVFKHDFSSELIAQLTGRPCPNGIDIPTSGKLPTARLATGDSFIGDGPTRERLGRQASLVDMEGYVVALAGQHFGIPVTVLKYVSDNADENAAGTWADAVAAGSRELDKARAVLGL